MGGLAGKVRVGTDCVRCAAFAGAVSRTCCTGCADRVGDTEEVKADRLVGLIIPASLSASS